MARRHRTEIGSARGSEDGGIRPASGARTVLIGVLAVVAVGILVCAAHWPALTAAAFHFDDGIYLTQNALVQRPGWASTWRFLSEVLRPSTVGGYYQPLAMISLMLDWAQGGRVENLRPFHRTSLALHVANTALIFALVYLLLGSIGRSSGLAPDLNAPVETGKARDIARRTSGLPGRVCVAAMVALLFGLHPLTVEPIPWTGERKTVLAAFFALWCLIFYVGYVLRRSRLLYAASLGAYVLALMSKPTSTPLPIVMLLLDYWPLGRISRRAILEKLPFFIIGGVSAVITFASQALTAVVQMPTAHHWSRIPLIFCHNIIFYLYKIVRPVNLSAHYAFPEPFDLSVPVIRAGVIGTCILVATLLLSLRRTRALLTGWLIFFFMILPTMQIVGFSNVIAADKFVYLPSVGFLLILAWGMMRLWNAPPAGLPVSAARVAVVVLVAVLATSEAVATRRYLECWQNGERLYKHMLRFTPNVPSLHASLGAALAMNGKPDEAIDHYLTALRFDPNFGGAHINMAVMLLDRGKPDEALVHLRRAQASMPRDFTVRNNMGLALAAQGKYDEAVAEYEAAARLNPDSLQVHHNLADALVRCGRFAGAIEEYERVLRMKPGVAEVHCKLGDALAQGGQHAKAVEQLVEALRLRPQYAEAHCRLADALAELSRSDEAVKHYLAALHIQPDYAEAHCNLAAELVAQGKVNEAYQHAGEAVRLRPGSAKAHYNLAVALAKQDKNEEAVREFREAIRLDSGLAEAHNNLGALLLGHGRTDEAVQHFSEAVRLKPGYLDAHFNLGYALEGLGRIDEAVNQYHEVLRAEPRNTVARERLNAALDRQAGVIPR